MRELLVGDVLRSGARRRPDAVAAFLDGEALTYAELEVRTDETCRALRAAGVRRGDRVVWQADVSLDAVPVYFATARIGAMFVPINPRYTSDEASRVVAHAEPRLILGDRANGHQTLAGLCALSLSDPGPGEPPRETDGHVIFYTSGTTGEPKGCVLSQRTQRLRAGTR